jgi:hypothetical protein
MTPRRLVLAPVLALAVLLASAGQAAALSGPVRDCNAHNAQTQHYTIPQLRGALATMPADIKEYTSCYQVIQNQLFQQLGIIKPRGGSGGGGGSSATMPLIVGLIAILLIGGSLAYRASRRRAPDEPPGPDAPGGGVAGP